MNPPFAVEPVPGLRERFRAYLRENLADEARSGSSDTRLEWRLSRFDNGLQLRDLARALGMDLSQAAVLDVGCAYGGDVLPLAEAGAEVVAIDLVDHDFPPLVQFAIRERL